MAGREENATVGLVLADNVGSGRGREDCVLADDELGHTVGRADLKDDLDGLGGEVTTIAADDDSLAFGVDGIKNGLNEVLRVVLQTGCTVRSA